MHVLITHNTVFTEFKICFFSLPSLLWTLYLSFDFWKCLCGLFLWLVIVGVACACLSKSQNLYLLLLMSSILWTLFKFRFLNMLIWLGFVAYSRCCLDMFIQIKKTFKYFFIETFICGSCFAPCLIFSQSSKVEWRLNMDTEFRMIHEESKHRS